MSGDKSGKFISFMGGIGSGKTTAANLVSKKFNFFYLKERYDKNVFLPLFYKDMSKWAFHSQLLFLAQKSKHLMDAKELLKNKSVVSDFDINQDLCYADIQNTMGNISDKEYFLYHEIYETIKHNLPKPDLIVYLKSTPEALLKRINKRGRGFEKKISASYLENLTNSIEKRLKESKKLSSVVVLKSDNSDFLKNIKDVDELFALINKHI